MPHVAGAHRGLDIWLIQRASAVVLAIVLPAFLIYAACQPTLDYASWRSLFEPLFVKVGALLFVAALLVHAWIGLREIFIDYVHHLGLRLALYFGFGVLYLGCLIWAVDILWGVR
ncbi:MAG: succinate dehydrogenase, hydrophobic membrane anchor protein [Hydrogenophilaceae bacterium]|nr:succinate dehydrogenase, hydrophobic membrane anchor protein [Hydrogenophilaceae bacterium]